MRRFASSIAGALFLVLGACGEKQLVVTNLENPDEQRTLGRPSDVEALVASAFRSVHQATDGVSLGIEGQLLTIGMENYSGLANAGMGPAAAIPRAGVDNSRGNQTLAEKYNPYLLSYRAARSAALGLNKMNDPSFTFYPANAAQVSRDRAFAWFVIGIAMGDVALIYDSGTITLPNDDPTLQKPYVAYDSLMKSALASLDSARTIGAAGAAAFPLPSTWINGNALTNAQFIALCRSWQARLRAGVARTPAQRAAVNWAQVIADAQAGNLTDFSITMINGSPAWSYYPAQMALYSSWHQMWQYMIGMADTSGNYTKYLATAPVSRAPFLIQTPDLRFPRGTHRASAGAADTGVTGSQNQNSGCGASACLQPANLAPMPFLRNRLSGADTPGDPLGFSMYDFYRFQAYYNANRNGAIITFARAELNGLIAEGAIYTGQFALATQYIDSSRVKRGLHALTGFVSDATTLVPGQDGVTGSNSCVPRVPAPPTFTSTACGTIVEAMKYEKRMETAYTHLGAWWIDGRGWGDLPNNSPINYPVPYQELDTRLKPIYTTAGAVGIGHYGL
jgi:hypothetical protein